MYLETIIALTVQCQIFHIVRANTTQKTTWKQKNIYDDDYSDAYYNPSRGYEPYWPHGDWVFEPPRDAASNGSTTPVPLVCGDECSYLYRNIKHVCAHRADNINYHGCWTKPCTGWNVDDLTRGFETHDTYCGFLDQQCRTGNETRLVFVHVGKCINNQELVYKPLYLSKQPVSRMKSYLSTLAELFKRLKTTPFG